MLCVYRLVCNGMGVDVCLYLRQGKNESKPIFSLLGILFIPSSVTAPLLPMKDAGMRAGWERGIFNRAVVPTLPGDLKPSGPGCLLHVMVAGISSGIVY